MIMTDYLKQLRFLIGLIAFAYTSLFVGQSDLSIFLFFIIGVITYQGVRIKDKLEAVAKTHGNPKLAAMYTRYMAPDLLCRFTPIVVFSTMLSQMGFGGIHLLSTMLAMYSITMIVMILEHAHMRQLALLVRIRKN